MQQPKVLVVQEIALKGIETLKQAGCLIVQPQTINQAELLEAAADCDAILVRTAEIGEQIIKHAPRLKVIARHGIGVDNIDLTAAADRGIYVCNVPHANINSVAEHVVGMMISLSHHIVRADKALREGNFNVRHTYIGTELSGKTLGLIGFGNIGQLVAHKCAYGLGMKVTAYDPYITNVQGMQHVQFTDSIDTILKESDFVSLHLPYSAQMHHFIGKPQFAKMKQTGFLINCARGGLVDENALYKAVATGEIAGAGLDVFEQEPAPVDHPLWSLDRVIVTPHMAAHTQESLLSMAVGAAEEIIAVLQGREPNHCVNRKLIAEKGVKA